MRSYRALRLEAVGIDVRVREIKKRASTRAPVGKVGWEEERDEGMVHSFCSLLATSKFWWV